MENDIGNFLAGAAASAVAFGYGLYSVKKMIKRRTDDNCYTVFEFETTSNPDVTLPDLSKTAVMGLELLHNPYTAPRYLQRATNKIPNDTLGRLLAEYGRGLAAQRLYRN
ncbi:MAG: hypothetical protein HYT70_01620 [Candidatus Aenigmarchaeota archaeon]|nr:hypothetical protein [Candidatus Aenigmarchaeota archaeon]